MVGYFTAVNNTAIKNHIEALIALPNCILRCNFKSVGTVAHLRDGNENAVKTCRMVERSCMIRQTGIRHNLIALYTISTLTVDSDNHVNSIGTSDSTVGFRCKCSNRKYGHNQNQCDDDRNNSINIFFHNVSLFTFHVCHLLFLFFVLFLMKKIYLTMRFRTYPDKE